MNEKYNLYQIRRIGDLINHSFHYFLRSSHLWKILATSILPLSLIYAYFALQLQIDIQQIGSQLQTPEDLFKIINYIKENPTGTTTLALSLFLNFWVSLISYSYVYLYSLGQDFSIQTILSFTTKKFLTAFSSQLLYIILLFSGFILFIAPGIYLMVPLQFYIIVRIIENQPLLDGVNRSIALTKGIWLENFGLLILGYILVSFADSLINFPMSFLKIHSSIGIAYGYFSIVIQSIIQFYIPFIFALQYYNILARRNETTQE